ncbi:MAG: type III pantothenate kinase [Acidobacteria bacterium]|nr:MAG: type III pantothenate kinase [Acidobacteriota bacterium]
MTEQAVLIDAGNTNTALGVYRGDELVGHLRLSTDRRRTADELAASILPLFAHLGLDPAATSAFLVASVVPPLKLSFELLAASYFNAEALFVDAAMVAAAGMPIRYPNPAEIGADRVINAVAARARYGAPVVVVDFGTATNFDVVDGDGAYAGGILAPGLGISAEALFAKASRLYRVDLTRPDELIGTSTASAMQSGIYYGYVGLVDGILKRLIDELPGLETIVATGGLAGLIAGGSSYIREVDPLLTLSGLKLVLDRHRAAGRRG